MDKQKKETKPDSRSCSCTGLRKASRRVSQIFDTALAPCGLKITQRAILAQINRSGPTHVGPLAEALVMDSGALAHTLKPLERDGFVAVEVDPADRRHRLISLTEAGRAKLAESEVLWLQAQQHFEAAFGRDEARALQTLLALLISDDFSDRFEKRLGGAGA